MGDQVIIIQGYQKTEKNDLASMLSMGHRKKINCATRMCCLRLRSSYTAAMAVKLCPDIRNPDSF